MIEIFFSVLRILYGIIFVLFLPGFSLVLVIFRKKEMDLLERIALAPVFSVIIIFILMIFPDNLLGIDITSLNMFLMVSIFTVVCLLIWATQSGNFKKILRMNK